MDTESVSYKTLKNAGYGFFSYTWAIVFSVFVTPVIVHKLGVQEFGVYVLVNTLTAFLSLIDFGLSTSMVKFVSDYHARAEFDKLKKLLDSARTLYIIIGAVGVAAFYLVGRFFLPYFHIAASSEFNIRTVFFIAGLGFFASAVNAFYAAIPQALQRYDIVTKLNTTQLTLSNLLILVLVLMGYKLKVIFLVNAVSLALLTVFYINYFKQLLPQISLGFNWLFSEIAKLYRFGLLVTATNLASNALIQLDRIIIPAFLGPAALTYYSLPGNVASKTSGITSGLAGVAFPLTSALAGKGEQQTIKSVYVKAFRNLTLVCAAITAAIIMFARKIMFFWLGKDFADRSTHILVILAATYFLLGLFTPLTYFLLGLGKVKFLAVFSAFLALVNIVLLFLLVPRYGITGAAWALLGGALPTLWAFYWTENKFLNLRGRILDYLKLYLKIFATTAVFFLLVKFTLLPLTQSLAALIIFGPLAVVLYLGLYKLLGFMEAEDWELAKSFALQIKSRLLGSKAS